MNMELKTIESRLIDLGLSCQITGDELIYLLKAIREYNKSHSKPQIGQDETNTETSFPPYLDGPKPGRK